MSGEIKEILDKLKDSVNYPMIDVPTMDGTDSEPMENTVLLEPNESKLLLDFLTNLQQIEQDHKRINCELRKENEILKENAIHNDKVVDKAKWNEMLYKSRNEKAIEYIKDNLYYLVDNDDKNLLNILNGGDKLSAREMFEKLGYKVMCNDDESIHYYLKKERYTRNIEFRKYSKDYTITGMEWLAKDENTWTIMNKNNMFRDEFDKYCAKYGNWITTYFNYIDMPLLQAINKQVEELEWNNK